MEAQTQNRHLSNEEKKYATKGKDFFLIDFFYKKFKVDKKSLQNVGRQNARNMIWIKATR